MFSFFKKVVVLLQMGADVYRKTGLLSNLCIFFIFCKIPTPSFIIILLFLSTTIPIDVKLSIRTVFFDSPN